jgi:sugar lactone lactonase YvrE
VDVALDGLGRVWVADAQQHEIRVFAPDGRHIRSFGRMGGGPAEFLGIAGMDWGPDGNLWVLDGGNSRFAVYDTAGKLVATHRREVNVVTAPWALGFDTQGRLYDLASISVAGDEPRRIVRFGPGLQPEDTFQLPAFRRPVFELVSKQGSATMVRQEVVPFAGVQEWCVDPLGSVWVGVTDRYRIVRHRFDGSVDLVVEREVEPARVTREQRRRVLESYAEFERQGGHVDASRIPRTLPVFENFFVDDRANLWVMFTPERGQPGRADLFNQAGRYLGPVELPRRVLSSPAPVVRGNRMVGVLQNEDQVESVVVLRLDEPRT